MDSFFNIDTSFRWLDLIPSESGTISYRGYSATPFNHWSYDTDWIVLIQFALNATYVRRVTALTPEEAVRNAVNSLIEDLDEDE